MKGLIETVKNPYFWLTQVITIIIFFIIGYNISHAQSPQTLYIAIDSTTNSQMLKRELECTNWSVRINPVVLQSLNPAQRSSFNEFCLRMDKTKKRISELWTVKYVNYHDDNSPRGTFPKYRIGKYRKWHTFNSQAFSETSYPLRTVEHLYEQWYYQDFVDVVLKKYKNDIDEFINKKHIIYNKWQNKVQEDRDTIGSLFMSMKYYEPYEQELKDKKLTSEYFPKIPEFEEPLKLPYE